jgi:hypothetical protein
MLQRQPSGLDALAAEWRTRLECSFMAGFAVHAIPWRPDTEALFTVLGVGKCATLLVRPDQYLAYVEAGLDRPALEAYLRGAPGLRAPRPPV